MILFNLDIYDIVQNKIFLSEDFTNFTPKHNCRSGNSFHHRITNSEGVLLPILIEGNQNRNCVGSYADRYAKGKSEIFFVRKKETPDKSYITIKTMNNATEIYQAYYSSNRTIDNQKDLNFLNKWISRNKILNETALNN